MIIGSVESLAIFELVFPIKLITSMSLDLACSSISIILLVSPERDIANTKTSFYTLLIKVEDEH